MSERSVLPGFLVYAHMCIAWDWIYEWLDAPDEPDKPGTYDDARSFARDCLAAMLGELEGGKT